MIRLLPLFMNNCSTIPAPLLIENEQRVASATLFRHKTDTRGLSLIRTKPHFPISVKLFKKMQSQTVKGSWAHNGRGVEGGGGGARNEEDLRLGGCQIPPAIPYFT